MITEIVNRIDLPGHLLSFGPSSERHPAPDRLNPLSDLIKFLQTECFPTSLWVMCFGVDFATGFRLRLQNKIFILVKEFKIRGVWKAVRYSGIGVFFSGIISVIQGCSFKEGGLAAMLLILLQFCSAPLDNGTDTGPPPVIVMFSAGQPGSGDLRTLGSGADGREGADNLCVAAVPASVTTSNVRAFISVTSADEIRDMPTNYGIPTDLPIISPTGKTVANDWVDLFDHAVTPLPDTLDNLDVTDPTDGGTRWMSGSSDNGGIAGALNCNDWTTGNFGIVLTSGLTNNPSSTWMAQGDTGCDNATVELLCLGF